MAYSIPDAPWIAETERTGYCRSGWWNAPPELYNDEDFVFCDICGDAIKIGEEIITSDHFCLCDSCFEKRELKRGRWGEG